MCVKQMQTSEYTNFKSIHSQKNYLRLFDTFFQDLRNFVVKIQMFKSICEKLLRFACLPLLVTSPINIELNIASANI